MRHRNTTKKLGRKKAPREMMLRNLASSVLIYEKVVTTEVKAKTVKPMVEKIITEAKKNNLSARRSLIEKLPQKMAVKKSMDVLGQRYQKRNGGYTRIIKMGNRLGDGSKMVQLELV